MAIGTDSSSSERLSVFSSLEAAAEMEKERAKNIRPVAKVFAFISSTLW
jgi:hypothetical protein